MKINTHKTKHRKMVGMCAAAAIAGTMLWTASSAHADITHVTRRDAGELTFAQVFSKQYGGTFQVASNGLDFTNGQITAKRVDDSKDQIFKADNGFSASMIAVNAGFAQGFGYFLGESGPTDSYANFTRIFHVKGQQGMVTKYAGPINPGTKFRFSRGGPQGYLSSSKTSDNNDGADHMVTYMIQGLDVNQPVLALFFEDLNASRADFDYNDLIVEVRGAEITHAPTPAAFGAGMVLLGGVLMRRRQRRTAEAM